MAVKENVAESWPLRVVALSRGAFVRIRVLVHLCLAGKAKSNAIATTNLNGHM